MRKKTYKREFLGLKNFWVEEIFPINYYLKISLHAQINVCIQLRFEYFSTFHTQYKKHDHLDFACDWCGKSKYALKVIECTN